MNLYKQFQVLNRMSAIHRYSRDRPIIPESDLEHTGWVSLFSYLMARELESTMYEGFTIDYRQLYGKSILHEMDEVLMGDTPSPTKYYNVDILEAHRRMERASVRTIAEFLGCGLEGGLGIYHTWLDSKGDSLEGRIVKMADLMAVVYKVWVEITLFNNLSFTNVLTEVSETLSNIVASPPKFDEDEEPRDSVNQFLFGKVHDAQSLLLECQLIVHGRTYLPQAITMEQPE